jgi:RNA polymerase sigma-70 factor (ECF subfamily)
LLDERRRQRRRPVEPVPTDAIEDEGIGGNVEEEALSRIEEQRMLHLLGRLSGDQRSVLLLRIIGDLRVEQVALVLGKTPGAVKALQRRGLAAIRREISRLSVTP